MHEWYYEMIFKRKSFHRFSGTSLLSGDEIKEIQNHIQCLQPLILWQLKENRQRGGFQPLLRVQPPELFLLGYPLFRLKVSVITPEKIKPKAMEPAMRRVMEPKRTPSV